MEDNMVNLSPDEKRKAQAWDALMRLLPILPEWERGRVLASDGRLLEWVLRNDPENNMPR